MFTRRRLLQAGASASLAAWAAKNASATPATPPLTTATVPANAAFPLGVASADPTPTGMVLWTHIAPDQRQPGEPVVVEMASDEDFSATILTQAVSGKTLDARDGCVTVIIDAGLQPDRYYWYRFKHGMHVSRTGRCRTLPITPVAETPLRIAVVNCQEFSNGYYAAYRHLADENDIAFVLHLGDSVYERVAGKAYLQHPHLGRTLMLPSGGDIAVDLHDYRALYRHYRTDPDYQEALARHSFFFQMDDHEIANNNYWNSERGVMGVSDHPFGDTTRYPDSDTRLTTLRQVALQAWSEYMPSRLSITPDAHTRPTLYRRVQAGDVAFLLIDSRSWRSRPPCKKTLLPLGCDDYRDNSLTLLGEPQRTWLLAQLQDPEPRWTFLASQIALSRIAVGNARDPWGVVNTDAWDGYAHEREQLMSVLSATQRRRFVALSGDMHASLACVLQAGELAPGLPDAEQRLGVEFMSPPISSPATIDLLFPRLRQHAIARKLAAGALELVFGVMNPHLRHICIQTHGYSVLEINAGQCRWQAKTVDIDVPSAQSPLRVVADFVFEPDMPGAGLRRLG